MKRKKRVLAAMSGGVDSSAAALLLKNEGFEVIGVTLRLHERKESGEGRPGLDDTEAARRAAEIIGITHRVLDLRKEFEELVVRPFCEEYLAGRTPNPCVVCNRKIKFGELLERTGESGADFMATGHYARAEKSGGRMLLKKGLDPKKDQSYFLYTMTQQQLEKILMPLGARTKETAVKLAREAGLPQAERPESQEICFVEDNDYRRFISERSPGRITPGKIIDEEGNLLGRHEGSAFFTIGQRRGLNLAAGRAYFVSEINGNTVTAGKSESVYRRECFIGNVNLITGELPPGGAAEIKIRHPGAARPGKITMLGEGSAKIEFDEPKWAVTPGQSAVFYSGETVLGGGIITKKEAGNGNRADSW